MDFKKLGQQVGRMKKQAEDRLGDRAEPENLKRDGKQLRNIMSGDGSLAEKAKEAKEKLSDPDRGPVPAEEKPTAPPAEAEDATGEKQRGKPPEPGR